MKRFPYSMTQPDIRPVEWGPRDWESRVPRIGTSRHLSPLVPDVTRHAANLIINSCARNDLRMGFYNFMSVNDFANTQFEELCQFIFDRFELGLYIGEFSEPARVAERIIENCVSMQMAEFSQVFDGPAEYAHSIRGTAPHDDLRLNLGLYNNVIKAIQCMLDGGSVDQVSDLLDVGGQRRDARDNRSSYSGTTYRNNSRSNNYGDRGYGSYNRDRQPERAPRDFRGQNDVYGRQNGYSNNQHRDDVDGYGIPIRREQAVTVRSVQENILSGANNNREGFAPISSNHSTMNKLDFPEMFPEEAAEWRAQQELEQRQRQQQQYQQEPQRHYNQPRQQEQQYQRSNQVRTNDAYQQEAQQIAQHHQLPVDLPPPPPPPAPPKPAAPPAPPPKLSAREESERTWFTDTHFCTPCGSIPLMFPKGKTEMDMISHTKPYFKGGEPMKDRSAEIIRTFTLAQIKDATTGIEITNPEDSVIVNEVMAVAPSLASLVDTLSTEATIASIKASPGNKRGQRKIFHKSGVVYSAVVGHPQLKAFQDGLRDCDTLMNMLNYLKSAVDSAIKAAAPEDAYLSDILAAADIYNRLITKEVNNYCRDVLNLMDGNVIDSALEDVQDLVRYLHSHDKIMQADALSGFLGRMNINMIDGYSPDTIEISSTIREDAMGDAADDEEVGMTYLAQSFNMTHIPYTMKELGQDTNGKIAVEMSTAAPLMKLALDLTKTNLESDPYLAQPNRLLVTRDRKAFRVYNYPSTPGVVILAPVELN